MKKVNLQIYVWAILTVFLLSGNRIFAQTPFSCTDGVSYQLRGNPSALFSVNLRTGAAASLFNAVALGNRNLTGLGYNINDNFLYASISGTNDIVRIASDGTVTQINVPGLPALAYTAGDVAPDGTLYLYVASSTTIQKVNLSTLAVSSITLTTAANLQDISINAAGTRIYGISANNGDLISYAITGGDLTQTAVGITATSVSTFMDATGDLFMITDGSSSVYEVSGPSFPNANSLSRVTPSLGVGITNTDGARCVTSMATTQPTFSCTPNQAFVSTTTKVITSNDCSFTQGQSTLLEYNLSSGSIVATSGQLIQTFGTERTAINNMGYNVTDGYLWAYRHGTNQLVRIGSDRSVDFFAIPGISNNCLYPETGVDNTIFFSGDINAAGIMYLLNGQIGDRFTRVDLNPLSATYLTKLSDVVLTPISPGAGTLSAIADIAFNPIDGNLYTVSTNNSLIRINPTSGLVTNLGAVTGIGAASGNNYVVAYFDNSGALYVQQATITNIVKIPNVSAGNVAGSMAGNGASFSGGDGARCPFSPIAPLLYSLSGNIFNDGNGLNDVGGALVNTSGTGALNPLNGATSLGTQLYVTLVNSDGNDLATIPVSTTGTYTFPNIAPGTYSIVLSSNPDGTTFANAPLATDWASTGEQLGLIPGGTDGIPNGIVAAISVTNSDVINANFGINKKPTGVPGIDASRVNPGGTTLSPVTSTMFQGSDFEDGSYTTPTNPANNNLKGRIVNLEPGTGGDLYYNGTLVTAGDPPIINFDPTLVYIDPAGTSNQDLVTVTFTYAVADDAGFFSDPKLLNVPFTTVLPVTLISFTVKIEGGMAELNWATTEETNSEKFELEHSVNGKIWRLIATIAAKGESKTLVSYNFTDVKPANGLNYYRLKMVDRAADRKDGTFAYSTIRSVRFSNSDQMAYVYPNPTSDIIQLGHTDLSKISKVELINTKGVIVYKSHPLDSPVSHNGISVNGFDNGAYILKVIFKDGSNYTHKVVINKYCQPGKLIFE
jgi:hypothetical protein